MALFEVYKTDGYGTAVSVLVTQSRKRAETEVEKLLIAGDDAWYEQIQ